MTDGRRGDRGDRGGRGSRGTSSPARTAKSAADPLPAFDLYRVIGVRPDATQQEITEAAAAMESRLRTAASRDRGGSTARLKRFNIARHWLADPERRRAYDRAVARGDAGAGAGAAAPARVRGGRVGSGPATRRSPTSGGASSWLNRPLTWVGAAVVVVVAAFLVLRPGGFGGGSGGSASPSAVVGIPASCPKTPPPAAPAGLQEVATIVTDKGSIEITLVNDLSPIAVGNFTALAGCGYYDGVVFHRVVQDFVIQGGDGQYGRISSFDAAKAGTGGPGYTIHDEPVTAQYARGTVAMARTQSPDSVGSQFFIVLSDNARQSLAAANTYQIIGTVTKGMDVVDAIAAAADGETPTHPVVMTTVTLGPATPAASVSPGGSTGGSGGPAGSVAAPSASAVPAPSNAGSSAGASPGY
ncbi:MAG TPA: peptidylprolyl isomerase [Candidatus Limnocylindrales bacterium]|nr:peptidylprolyl isomerase [Candidatus Limnocylindrales bacterium]